MRWPTPPASATERALPFAARATQRPRRLRLVLALVAVIEIGAARPELPGARVHGLVSGADAELPAALAQRRFGRAGAGRDLVVGEPQAFHAAQFRRTRLLEPREPPLGREQLLELEQEPGIDPRGLCDRFHPQARDHAALHPAHPPAPARAPPHPPPAPPAAPPPLLPP